MEEKSTLKVPQNIILEDRKKVTVTGVIDIDNFDESVVVLYTGIGDLYIKGKDLHISRLSVETGEIMCHGEINSIHYEDPKVKTKGFIDRIFK